MQIKYVTGFYFSEDYQRVALIRKNKPKWQAGRLNGIGGKIENNETPDMAMIREFHEEAGVYTQSWRRVCTLTEARATIIFYETNGDLSNVRQMEEEEIEIIETDKVLEYDTISNLKWLIPLAKDRNLMTGTINETIKMHIE